MRMTVIPKFWNPFWTPQNWRMKCKIEMKCYIFLSVQQLQQTATLKCKLRWETGLLNTSLDELGHGRGEDAVGGALAQLDDALLDALLADGALLGWRDRAADAAPGIRVGSQVESTRVKPWIESDFVIYLSIIESAIWVRLLGHLESIRVKSWLKSDFMTHLLQIESYT